MTTAKGNDQNEIWTLKKYMKLKELYKVDCMKVELVAW